MKNLSKIAAFVITLSLFFFACNQDESTFEKNDLSVIEKESTFLSLNTQKLGIRSIMLPDKRSKLLINSSEVKINGSIFNVSDLEIDFIEEIDYFMISLDNNRSVKVNKDGSDIIINHSSLKFSLPELDKYEFKDIALNEIYTLLVISEDLLLKGLNRTNSVNTFSKIKCGDWVYINTGTGRSSSEARLQREIDGVLEDNPNCTKLGGIDTSCIWDNNACWSTIEIECNC